MANRWTGWNMSAQSSTKDTPAEVSRPSQHGEDLHHR